MTRPYTVQLSQFASRQVQREQQPLPWQGW
jgi:hypothetical protein